MILINFYFNENISTYVVVTKENIDMRNHLKESVFEELADKSSRKVCAENSIILV